MTTLRTRLARAPLANLVAVALAIVLVGLYALTTDPVPAGRASRSIDGLAVVLFVAACAALLWRRRFPAAVALVTLVISYVWYTAEYTNRLVDVPTIAAYYWLGATGDRRRQLGIGGLTVAVQLVTALAEPEAAGRPARHGRASRRGRRRPVVRTGARRRLAGAGHPARRRKLIRPSQWLEGGNLMATTLALDHLVLVVDDVERTLDWYGRHVGLGGVRVDEWRRGEAPFPSLRVDEATIIDLVPHGGDDGAGRGHLDHICFVVSPEDLKTLAADPELEVVDEGLRFGARGIGDSIYVRDPDDLLVEFRSYAD